MFHLQSEHPGSTCPEHRDRSSERAQDISVLENQSSRPGSCQGTWGPFGQSQPVTVEKKPRPEDTSVPAWCPTRQGHLARAPLDCVTHMAGETGIHEHPQGTWCRAHTGQGV